MLILIASCDTCHPQELQVNGTVVPYIQPFAQQMGMANGGKPGGAGVNGKYNEMARMAMSHPAFLNQAEQRPQVVFGSHSQFEVKMESGNNLFFQLTLSVRISKSVKCLLRRLGSWVARTSSTADLCTTYRSSSEPDKKYDFSSSHLMLAQGQPAHLQTVDEKDCHRDWAT